VKAITDPNDIFRNLYEKTCRAAMAVRLPESRDGFTRAPIATPQALRLSCAGWRTPPPKPGGVSRRRPWLGILSSAANAM